jgi:hypothetical protein
MNIKERLEQIYDWSKDNEGATLLVVTNANNEKPKDYVRKLFDKLIKNKSYAGAAFSVNVSILLCRVELSNGVTIYITENEGTAREVLSQTYLDWIGLVGDDGGIDLHETFYKGDLARGESSPNNVPPEMSK